VCPLLLTTHRVTVRSGRHEPNLDGHCPGWHCRRLIATEKTLPWHRAATYGTATILLTLGELVLAAPQALPGLTVSGHQPHVTAALVLMRIRVSIRDGRRTVCPSRSSGGSAFRKGWSLGRPPGAARRTRWDQML